MVTNIINTDNVSGEINTLLNHHIRKNLTYEISMLSGLDTITSNKNEILKLPKAMKNYTINDKELRDQISMYIDIWSRNSLSFIV